MLRSRFQQTSDAFWGEKPAISAHDLDEAVKQRAQTVRLWYMAAFIILHALWIAVWLPINLVVFPFLVSQILLLLHIPVGIMFILEIAEFSSNTSLWAKKIAGWLMSVAVLEIVTSIIDIVVRSVFLPGNEHVFNIIFASISIVVSLIVAAKARYIVRMVEISIENADDHKIQHDTEQIIDRMK